ncbi:DUF3224 domain-containing protein [Kitasatospora sp. NPDC086801]|uniref:DUF3224 domain-containing protein n=1 Tax=Kitasatospora sp. NPDC086801 TaxID=3364066 RepID=UPI0037F4E780
MGAKASGSFELTGFEPVETEEREGVAFGRVRVSKNFTGGLSGTGEFHLTVDEAGTHAYVLEYELG